MKKITDRRPYFKKYDAETRPSCSLRARSPQHKREIHNAAAALGLTMTDLVWASVAEYLEKNLELEKIEK